MYSQNFIQRHKCNPEDFTRKRKLTFQTTFLFLINFLKGSCQDELDHFFKALFKKDVAEKVVTKMAFCKARKKINFSAFIDFNHHLINFFYKKFSIKTWYGFKLMAIDGSSLKLNSNTELKNEFGELKPRHGTLTTMARISQMFDVLNKITVCASISPYKENEREMLKNHILNIMPKDLLLLDRGYPAFWVFKLILSFQGEFCARTSKCWKVLKTLSCSEKKDEIIFLEVPETSKKECFEMGLDTKRFKVRILKIFLKSGETEYLITSLTNQKLYPYKLFQDLYHKRWPVEEDYKLMKNRIQISNFTGCSALSVYQDFYAKIFAKNLAFIFSFHANELAKKNSAHKQYVYQINFSEMISKSKDSLVLLFYRSEYVVKKMILQLYILFSSSTEPIRDGRSFPRKHKVKPPAFYKNYRPCR